MSISACSLPLALTMGEPAGIGGEIALGAWRRRDEGIPPFYVLDDPDRLAALAKGLGWRIAVQAIGAPAETAAAFAAALPVVPLSASPRARPGHPDRADARLVVESIDRAVADAQSGRAA